MSSKSRIAAPKFRPTFLMGVMGVVMFSALDLSSYCHPTEEGDRMATAIKTAGMLLNRRVPDPTAEESYDYAELTWRMLEDVEFKDVYIEELDAYYWKPTFGDIVNGLEGKEVHITGYMIPVDLDEDFYVLSRYPFANCFFCGGAGPESVIDLRFEGKSPRVYQTDERLTFAGKFRLNSDDVYQMNYILDGCFEHTP
tara:strand:+ start:1396 stop:1986 length:591 start_codon:yes stop_codon:yes gene_type:complete